MLAEDITMDLYPEACTMSVPPRVFCPDGKHRAKMGFHVRLTLCAGAIQGEWCAPFRSKQLVIYSFGAEPVRTFALFPQPQSMGHTLMHCSLYQRPLEARGAFDTWSNAQRGICAALDGRGRRHFFVSCQARRVARNKTIRQGHMFRSMVPCRRVLRHRGSVHWDSLTHTQHPLSAPSLASSLIATPQPSAQPSDPHAHIPTRIRPHPRPAPTQRQRRTPAPRRA